MKNGICPEEVHLLRDVSFYDEEGPTFGQPAYWLACEKYATAGGSQKNSPYEGSLYNHKTGEGLAFTNKRDDVTCQDCRGSAAEHDSERETSLGVQYPWVVVELSPQVLDYCEQLKEIGLYGTSRDEVIERLVCRQIQEMIHGGKLQPIGQDS